MGRQQFENPIGAEKVQQVQKGMSKDQVAEILGAPNEITFSNKEHDPLRVFAYTYEHSVTRHTVVFFAIINFGNSDEKKDRVIVFFDDDERVASVGASLYADEATYGFPFGS